MTKATFYRRQGRKYVPVTYYDSELDNSWHEGAHLVIVEPNTTIRRVGINPDFATVIAAASYARDAMANAIFEASKFRPVDQPLTQEQLDAWHQMEKVMGSRLYTLTSTSAYDVVDAGIEAMTKRANELLENPAVKRAWDNFMMVCQLTK